MPEVSLNPANFRQDPNSSGVPRANVSREERAAMIAALVREREGCIRRGLDERAKLIDAELARYGHEAEKPSERAEKRPSSRSHAKR